MRISREDYAAATPSAAMPSAECASFKTPAQFNALHALAVINEMASRPHDLTSRNGLVERLRYIAQYSKECCESIRAGESGGAQ